MSLTKQLGEMRCDKNECDARLPCKFRFAAETPPPLITVADAPSGPNRCPFDDSAQLGRNHAELSHLRDDVDDPPGLSDSTVGEPEDEDLVVGDGFAGWW